MLERGTLLIAEPFLGDPNFERSVVLLCEHNDQGAFGFVLTQATEITLPELLEDFIDPDFKVYIGGPVEQNTLHILHNSPDLTEGGQVIKDGITWGGNIDQIKTQLNAGLLQGSQIRFLLGYSGWDSGQLEEEIASGTWLVSQLSITDLLEIPATELWRELLRRTGGKYKEWVNYPSDPRLN